MNLVGDPPLLELRGIHKRFGAVRALAGVSLRVQRGEIHALCGENGAGKSTLMNIIDGIHQPDAGEILLDGQPVVIRGPAQAMRLGIGLVHQEIALCGDATVAENIFMPELRERRSPWMNLGELNARARVALAKLGRADIAPDQRVSELSLSAQQLVEIAKALTLNCRLLILDEPTAALTERESAALFEVLHAMKAQGMGIIYISHRMAEIFAHCDRATVLRDGCDVESTALADITPDELIRSMVGRNLGQYYPPKAAEPDAGDCLLDVDDVADGEQVHGISFRLRRGEILGISGLMGAGRSELAQTICGLRRARRGRVHLRGRLVAPRHYGDALKQGLAYLSEDRKAAGLFLDLPIAQNVSAMALRSVSSRWGLIERAIERRLAQSLGTRLRLKADGVDTPAASLSGGNQQKVAIAKLLATEPAVLFMDEPTRGVDVGAKSEIHHLLRELAGQGVGIVVISSELPEIIGLCDRALVVREGKVAGELAAHEMTEEKLLRLASGLDLRNLEAA